MANKCFMIYLAILLGAGLQVGWAQGLVVDSTWTMASDSFQPRRFWVGTGVIVGADVATLVGLNHLWYSGYERGGFHWHDDWHNWLQQDKLGHMVTSWHIARILGKYGRWSGLSRKQAGWYGGIISTVFQSQIELLDGFSERWGASAGDIMFNTIGGVLGGASGGLSETGCGHGQVFLSSFPFLRPG